MPFCIQLFVFENRVKSIGNLMSNRVTHPVVPLSASRRISNLFLSSSFSSSYFLSFPLTLGINVFVPVLQFLHCCPHQPKMVPSDSLPSYAGNTITVDCNQTYVKSMPADEALADGPVPVNEWANKQELPGEQV